MARNIEYSYFSLFLFDCGSLKVGLVWIIFCNGWYFTRLNASSYSFNFSFSLFWQEIQKKNSSKASHVKSSANLVKSKITYVSVLVSCYLLLTNFQFHV
jgi:hypothetical protein